MKEPVCGAMYTDRNEVGVLSTGPLEFVLPQICFKIGVVPIVDQVDHLSGIIDMGCSFVQHNCLLLSLFQYLSVWDFLCLFLARFRPANLYGLDLNMVFQDLHTHESEKRTFP